MPKVKKHERKGNRVAFEVSQRCLQIRDNYAIKNSQFYEAAVLCLDRAPESLKVQCITEAVLGDARSETKTVLQTVAS